MRKIITLMLVLSLIMSFTIFANAKNSKKEIVEEGTGLETSNVENLNVSTEPPNDEEEGLFSIKSLSKPSSFIDISNGGRIDFGGTASSSTLYLNNGFTGVASVWIEVQNHSQYDLTVKCYRDEFIDIRVDTEIISSGSTTYYSITGLDANKKYYLAFLAPSDFDGYVEEL